MSYKGITGLISLLLMIFIFKDAIKSVMFLLVSGAITLVIYFLHEYAWEKLIVKYIKKRINPK